ncbi:MAG: mechanosensitive ion channel [Deltaproteobacteria bacterium]|nr:mechanosensitive ion channel [Deltaproteobacteria bacterium]
MTVKKNSLENQLLMPIRVTFIGLLLLMVLLAANVPSVSSEEAGSSRTEDTPEFGIAKDIGEAAKREAARVKEDLEKQAKSLFEREPLGWDLQTYQYLYTAAVSLPSRIPEITGHLAEESRVLGLIGSLLVLLFVMALLYSLIGRRRVIQWVERKAQPISLHFPEGSYPYFLSLLKVVVSALIPLMLLGLVSLINEMIEYRAAWFRLTGRMLVLWAVGAPILRLLKETLTRDLFEVTANYGKVIFRYGRLIILYVLIGIAFFWAASIFKVRTDVLELIRFSVSLSVVTVLFLFFLKKTALLSLLPKLPYRGYLWVFNFLKNYYYLLLIVSFLAALMWCFGYQGLGKLVLTKIWFTAGALLAVTIIYYNLSERLKRWSLKLKASGEAAQLLVRSMKTVLLYATVLFTAIAVLNLLGLLNPLKSIMSFPMFQLGDTRVTPWLIINAVVILLAFVFASRLLQAYLDYKVYPTIGVDPGLGYALNTFFRYMSLAIGFLISIRLVGIDLRFLLVFAGAAGIGIGLGLQNMAANVISGFTIIFGGKIRKGDWIEVSESLGVVTDIYLRATKVRNRDNIEYLIPNSDLISKTIVNYSLSSPLIRIEIPVGVSYNADPLHVEQIMLKVAEKEPLVSNNEEPQVRFVEYGDSSINFELLVWIDVRTVPRRKVRSALYFAIFDEFKKAGIEIPFPQRDVHVRSKVD